MCFGIICDVFLTYVQMFPSIYLWVWFLHNNGNALLVLICSCFNNHRTVLPLAQYHKNTKESNMTCFNHKHNICILEHHTHMLPSLHSRYDNIVWHNIVHASTIIKPCFKVQLYGFIAEPDHDIAWRKT